VCVCYSAWKDVDVKAGFVGSVESPQINSSQTAATFDLTDDSSQNVLHKVNITTGRLFIWGRLYRRIFRRNRADPHRFVSRECGMNAGIHS